MGIVLLTAAGQVENRYAAYTGEILRTEGYNQLRTTDIEELTAPLSDQALYVLTPCRLTPAQVELLLDHVANGGRLIAIRPSKPLVSALGLGLAGSATVDGYVSISENHPVGKALIHESIQFHGGAAHLALTEQVTSWEQVAELWSTANQPSGYPALVITQHGAGRVAIYAYDVGETIAAIRQGDPRLANCTTTSVVDGRFRPADMFMGHTDPAKAHIPQADVHGNLLANTVHWMSPQPLVRLWYYPQPEQRSALVMTSDDDWSKLHEFEALMQALEAVEGHITFYLMEDTAVTREHVQQWAARGHSFGVHPYIREPYARYAQVEGHISRHIQSFADRFGFRPITTRSHCIQWTDYLGEMHILLEQGIGMEFNYLNGSLWPVHYMTGSGRPMKAVEQDGRILDIFQHPSHFSEDGLLPDSIAPSNLGWTTQEAIEHVTDVIDEAADRFHTPLCLNSHPRSFVRYSGEFVTAVINHAHQRGVPIPSADEWLHFTRARYTAVVSAVNESEHEISVRVDIEHPTEQLCVMIPVDENVTQAAVEVDGQSSEAGSVDVFGFSFLMVPLVFGDARSRQISVHFTGGKKG
jgi:hypothetical protein